MFLYSMENGLLLKPTRPAMSLDSTFTQRAFGKGGPDGELWVGYTAYDENSPVSYCHVLMNSFYGSVGRSGILSLPLRSQQNIN